MAYLEGEIPTIVSGGNNGGNGGFGFGNDAWVLIILFALIFGWGNGNGGFGGGNGGSSGTLTRGDLCMDMNFNDLQNAVRSGVAENNSNFRTVDNAVCTLGYQNLDLISRVQTQLSNEFRGLDGSINAVNSQIANCCCELKGGIADLKYANAMNTRDIIESQNANYRALHDEIVANRIEDKNAQIMAQQNEINALRLSASQARQNEYLVNQLRPCPIPAYITCNPFASQSNNGNCGCGL